MAKRIHGSWKNKIVASDLQEERDKCDFDQAEALSTAIAPAQWAAVQDAHKAMVEHPELANTHKFYDMTRQEQMEHQFKKSAAAYRLRPDWFHGYRAGGFSWQYAQLGQSCHAMHYMMFQTLIETLATEEQAEKWLPLSRHLRILGCYAQTELGHGSDVASLETTATFDQETDEFVIHTPTPTATKWWPGDMGRMANHAVVFAQLVIEGTKYNVCPFIVQIRETNTHMPCKGIKCGDLGPKLGYSSKDNGWLSFDHVRIPRSQMLQKFVSVDREGEFSIDGDLRVLYSTMMSVRKMLIEGAPYVLGQACLIGIRYSCVRRQFKNTTGSKEETKLIDYQTQQMKLFPLVGMAKVQYACSRYIGGRHDKMLEEIEKENFDSLDELHHLTSGFKSLHSQQTYEGLLQVRQALGGAGYSAWSGIPQLIDNFSPQVTFEGDNTVMLIQSTRYLRKLYKKARKGTVISSPVFGYLNHIDANLQKVCSAKTPEDLCSASLVLEALEVNASHHIKSTFTQIEESKAPAKQAENDMFALGLLKMALAHLYAVASKMTELEHLESALKCPNARIHAENIRILYGLCQLQKDPAGLYECGYFTPGSRAMVDAAIKLVLARLRPQILPLAEVVPHADEALMSAIGNSYGDIYETHLEWAASSRLNDDKGSIPDGYMEHIMPILQGKL